MLAVSEDTAKLAHWAIDKQWSAQHPGMSDVPYRNVASSCEVVGAATLFTPYPAPPSLKFMIGAAIYTNC